MWFQTRPYSHRAKHLGLHDHLGLVPPLILLEKNRVNFGASKKVSNKIPVNGLTSPKGQGNSDIVDHFVDLIGSGCLRQDMQGKFAAQTGFIIFGLGHCDQRARLFHPVAPRGFFEKGNAQPRWKRDGSRRILAACQTSLPRVRTIQAKNPSKGGTMRAALPREGGIADQHDKRK